MNFKVIKSYDSLYDHKLPSNDFETQLSDIKKDLEKTASAISKYCSERLAGELHSLELKEIKELAKLVNDTHKTLFGDTQVNVTNIQNNFSQTNLAFFKGSLKDEI